MQRETMTRPAAIRVIGIGSGGGNAINRMLLRGLRGVNFVVVNTDALALAGLPAAVRLAVGPPVARGLGTGGDWHMGE